jgi:hypothetical protein
MAGAILGVADRGVKEQRSSLLDKGGVSIYMNGIQ